MTICDPSAEAPFVTIRFVHAIAAGAAVRKTAKNNTLFLMLIVVSFCKYSATLAVKQEREKNSKKVLPDLTNGKIIYI